MHPSTRAVANPRSPQPIAWALGCWLALCPFASAQNDNFADRTLIEGGAATVTADNSAATAEADEPEHAIGQPAAASVWWQWNAPQDGYYEFNTQGSSFDTLLAVYAGLSFDDLSNRGRNNDTYTLEQQSRVIFYAETDELFTIAVDGDGTASGSITLNLLPAILRNDEFGERIPIAGTEVFDVQSNVGGTVGLFEPNHIESLNSTASIWWDWSCTTDGWVTVDTKGSTFDTVAAVYIQNVILLANNNNYYRDGDGDIALHPFDVSDEFNARLRFYATAGNSYQIAVDGTDGLEVGSAQLTITQSRSHPSNDNVNSATVLNSFADGDFITASASGSNIGASVELGEPDHNPGDETSASTTVWYEWQSPPVDRLVNINTFDSRFDTILAVYSREGSNLIRWATNDDHEDADEFQSAVTFHSSAGITYLIAVDGYSGEQGRVGLKLTAGDQQNDNAEAAVAQFGFEWQSTSNSTAATAQPDEPPHAPGQAATASMWWRWESPLDGDIRVDTLGSDFDTLLAVYTGVDPDSDQPFANPDLTLIGSNDDDPTTSTGHSTVQIAVEYGETYYIAVDGKASETGDVLLNFATLGGFNYWLAQFPSLTALLDLPLDDPRRVGALPDGDNDRDGFPNRLEAAFGLNPELNSLPDGTDPNRANAPVYSYDGSNMNIDFTLDPLFAQVGDNADSTRVRVYAERSFNGTIWSSLSAKRVSGNRYRVTFPLAAGQDFGLFRVTASDSELGQ